MKRQGNDAARRTFLARWPQDRALPTSGDRVLGKNWIKAVFVDRMYYGDGGASQAPAASTAAPAATAQAAAAPAATKAPDLFGGLFDSPQPVRSAPPAQVPQQQSAQPAGGNVNWDAFASAAFSAPQAASAPAAVTSFAPPPAAHQSNAALPPQGFAAPAPAASAAPAAPQAPQQVDMFGGLTMEPPQPAQQPAQQPAEQPAQQPAQQQDVPPQAQPQPPVVETRAPRAALDEDFWAAPAQPQVPPQMMGAPHLRLRGRRPKIFI